MEWYKETMSLQNQTGRGLKRGVQYQIMIEESRDCTEVAEENYLDIYKMKWLKSMWCWVQDCLGQTARMYGLSRLMLEYGLTRIPHTQKWTFKTHK